MGMYDTINGEQVKCFPWVSFYDKIPCYHGGDLRNYNTGDEVPYKTLHYNYGENFIILDVNQHYPDGFFPYNYVLHIIVDGKVKDTFKNEIGNIDWSINKNIVTYYGELLNIKKSEDILNYIKEQRECWKKYREINARDNELFKELMNHMNGITLLDKDSEERKLRNKKIEEIRKLIDEEREKIEPELDAINKEFSKWLINDIDDLIKLGSYVSAYRTELEAKRYDNAKSCEEIIRILLDSDDTLFGRYLKWQKIDPLNYELCKLIWA